MSTKWKSVIPVVALVLGVSLGLFAADTPTADAAGHKTVTVHRGGQEIDSYPDAWSAAPGSSGAMAIRLEDRMVYLSPHAWDKIIVVSK